MTPLRLDSKDIDELVVVPTSHTSSSDFPAVAELVLPSVSSDPSMATVSVSAAADLSRRVRFGTVKTRYYPQILGDHPLCPDGLPITFGWTWYEDDEGYGQQDNDADESEAHEHHFLAQAPPSVDDYERRNCIGGGRTCTATRATQGARVPKLSLVTRMSLLLESGISEEEIAQRIRTSQRIRRQTRLQQQRARMWLYFLEQAERALQSWRSSFDLATGTIASCTWTWSV